MTENNNKPKREKKSGGNGWQAYVVPADVSDETIQAIYEDIMKKAGLPIKHSLLKKPEQPEQSGQ